MVQLHILIERSENISNAHSNGVDKGHHVNDKYDLQAISAALVAPYNTMCCSPLYLLSSHGQFLQLEKIAEQFYEEADHKKVKHSSHKVKSP